MIKKIGVFLGAVGLFSFIGCHRRMRVVTYINTQGIPAQTFLNGSLLLTTLTLIISTSISPARIRVAELVVMLETILIGVSQGLQLGVRSRAIPQEIVPVDTHIMSK